MAFIKKYQTIIFFFLMVLVLFFRVIVESTRYRTPDSHYYIEVATNIVNGLGAIGPKVFDYNIEKGTLIPLYKDTPFGQPNLYKQEYFAVWPLGYPASIALVSYITSLEPLWASKLLNIVLLAFDFYLLGLIFGRKFNLVFFYFGSFTMLEICSYTWSENLFLPFFLLLIYSLTNIKNDTSLSIRTIVLLSVSLIGMCLARYASVVFFCTPLAILIFYFYKADLSKAKTIFIGMALSSVALVCYLYFNYLQTGYLTGMPRMNTQEYTGIELIKRFFIGIFNQIHIVKQYRISGLLDFLWYGVTVLLQLFLMFYVWFAIRKRRLDYRMSFENKMLMYSGVLYLFFLVYMTFTSTIDPFDYRTLTPFSFPVIIVILNEVEKKIIETKNENAIWMIKLFFVFSLLLNLPKKQLLEWVMNY